MKNQTPRSAEWSLAGIIRTVDIKEITAYLQSLPPYAKLKPEERTQADLAIQEVCNRVSSGALGEINSERPIKIGISGIAGVKGAARMHVDCSAISGPAIK